MASGPFDIAALGVLTGLIFVVGALAVALIITLTQIRVRRLKAEMLHKERMLALEKGIPMPVDYLESKPQRRPYVRGMVFTGIGLGIIAMGLLSPDKDLAGIGIVFLLVGVALIIGDRITGPRESRPKNGSPVYPEAQSMYRGSDNPS